MYEFITTTERDFSTLWRLRLVTMKPIIENFYLWDNAIEKKKLKECLYKRDMDLIQFNEETVGMYSANIYPDSIGVLDLQILNKYQGQGHGSFVLSQLIKLSIKLMLPIRLSVFKNTPAVNFYKKHSFVEIDNRGSTLFLEWSPFIKASEKLCLDY
jgi:ribosomal protein S18 acetylase RimI-like enzyme